jgi:hypothetical protein
MEQWCSDCEVLFVRSLGSSTSSSPPIKFTVTLGRSGLILLLKCQVVSYVYKPYLFKTPNSFNLKIYLYGAKKYMSELPTPGRNFRHPSEVSGLS